MTEADVQKAVFQHLRERGAPGVVYWHVDNTPQTRRKAGYREGVHDVHLLHRGHFFTMELKVKGNSASQAQQQFASDVNAQGGSASVVHGLDQALKFLETHGLIHPAS